MATQLLKSLYSIRRTLSSKASIVGLVATGLIATGASVYTVKPGYSAVVFNRITTSTFCVEKGTHFLLPWVHMPYLIDVSQSVHSLHLGFYTKDKKKVEIKLHALARPDVEKLATLHSQTGSDFCNKLLSCIGGGLPDLAGSFTLAEIVGDEKYFLDTIAAHLSGKAKKLGILLEIISFEYLYPQKEGVFYHSSK